ncbi:MAG: type II toxin-antitoxin system VapC family toxin [Myxococcota bacterium]
MKPVAYVETSVISYLVSQPSRDLVTAARQQLTREWWSTRRSDYHLVASPLVLLEAERGDRAAADRRLAALQSLELLALTEKARSLTSALLLARALPEAAADDALHIALAAAHGADVVLTWNFKHIANPFTWPAIWSVVEAEGCNAPTLCTPEQLLEDGL